MNALKKSQVDLNREQLKQLDIIYPACALVWWRDYGWKETRIMRRFLTTQTVWDECADYGLEKSIFQMLEDETGIEMMLDGVKSYHEYAYFDAAMWNGKPLDMAQTIYMRQQQKKWIAPMILASVCISLHRDEKWGYERLADFISKVDGLRRDLGEDPKAYYQKLYDVTGINWRTMWRDEHKA